MGSDVRSTSAAPHQTVDQVAHCAAETDRDRLDAERWLNEGGARIPETVGLCS